MKPTVLFLTVLGCVAASPNGYYHQEYNYKTSASSYKNNELQHKTDDQGYYRKDGDLEGRVRPRVDANSEHSEYVNPNSRTGEQYTGSNGDLSSYGHMSANSGAYGTHGLSSEGLAHSSRIGGSTGAYSGYNSGSYGSNTYGVSSNLQSVTSNIQHELESELQRAVQDSRGYSQSTISISDLERELRRNLTERLNTELANRYGQQSIRGGLSYTISGGRVHSTANYDNQELQDLRRQLENNLLNQLRSQYSRSSSYYQTQQGAQSTYGYTTTVRPVYYTHYQTSYRPNTNSYVQYTPVANPETITAIASRVQSQLDSRLNEILEDVQRKYFSSSSSYSLTNADVVLENLRNDLRNNVTYLLNENVKNNYGNQIPRDGYMYSVGTNRQTSSQHNYSIQDLERLRSEIERNLIQKLNRDFESYRSRWSHQSQSQSSHRTGSVQYNGYSTPRYDVYSTPRYVYESEPAGSSPSHIGVKGSTVNSNRRFNLLAGSSYGGYETSGSSGGNIAQLQSQLQQDLSRQLQAALSRSHYGSYSSVSGSYNPQSYQTSYQQLSDELNRNLTRQLQEYSATGSYSTHGNYDQSQLESLRNQLQSNLLRQLQQGLQQSYQSSSSYSASSSSSDSSGSYRPVRGFDNYQSGHYRSGVIGTNGADCVGDDPNAYNTHRMKRSYQPYRSQPLGISSSGNYRGYNPNYGYSGSYQQQQLGQQVDESDLTQQVQNPTLERFQHGSLTQQQVGLGQQIDDSDLTQQVENPGIGRLQIGSQNQQVDDSELTEQVVGSSTGKLQLGSQSQQQVELGQIVDDSDLTQQVEDSNFGRLQVGSPRQQQVQLGQQVDNSDLTQQVEDANFGRLQVGSPRQQQVQLGQQVDDSDLTQQVEDANFGRLQVGSPTLQQVQLGQPVDDSDLTQQVEDANFGRLQVGSQRQQQVQLGQQVDDSDLTQQVEDANFGRLQVGSQRQQQVQLGQETDNSELTQQVDDSASGRLQLGSQSHQQVQLGQQVDESDLTHQVENSNFGRLQVGSQSHQQVQLGQEVDDSELTQQVEDSGIGRLQLGSQSHQQVQLGQQVDDSDLTQQVEESASGRLQVGSQSHQQVQLGQQVDDSDLTQQVEDSGIGRLQVGSQRQVDLGQQVEDSQIQHVNYGKLQQQVDGFEQTQQEDDKSFGKLESSSVTQQQYGRPLSNLGQNIQIGQLEDNSDSTQQVQHPFAGQISDVSQNSQQTEDFGGFTSQGQQQTSFEPHHHTSGNRQSHRHIYIGSNFDKNQEQVAQQLENELSSQLSDAVRNYYLNSDASNYRLTYQNLLRELERNLTKQLQTVGPSTGGTHYSYTYVFSGPQTESLHKQLENALKLQLQREISVAGGNRYISQQNSNSEVVHQENNFGTLEGQTRNHRYYPVNHQIGNSQITQHPTDGQQFLNQQQTQQEDLNSHLSQTDNSQLHQYHNTRPYFSSNLQFGNRPLRQKPVDNTNFINTEIDQQQNLYPIQDIVSQNIQNNKPSLTSQDHVIQHSTSQGEEANTEYLIEPLAQQNGEQETDEQQNIEFSPQTSAIGRGDVTESNLNFRPNSPSTSNQIENNQNANNKQNENINQAQSQSLADAEQEADLLLHTLRQSIRNRESQSGYRSVNANEPPTYSQVLSQGNQEGQQQEEQTITVNQNQDSYQTYLNDRQVHLAQQLQIDLSKELEDAISQNQYLVTQTVSTATGPHVSRNINYEQLLKDLRRNITDQLEQTFGTRQTGYFSNAYTPYKLTPEQQEKLINDLTQKLQRDFEISYRLHAQSSGQNGFNNGIMYSSSSGAYETDSRRYNGYGSHTVPIQYADTNVLPDGESASELQPIAQEHPTIVQNVQPQPNYNIGVKSSRRFRVTSAPTALLASQSEVQPPQAELITPVQVNPSSGAQEITDLNKNPEDETQENLTWWKRFGNKIKSGASSLKEKIIG